MDPRDAQVEIVEERERSRYAARLDGELAGVAEYVREDGVITFTHTVVPERFEGRGIAGRLAAAALDAARADGLQVVARCAYIAGYIERHPEYADLVAEHA